VITIVDSTHVTDALFIPGTFFANQVTHADTLILSKLQLYKKDTLALVERIKTLNERAGIWAKPWNDLKDSDFAALDFGGSVGVGADDDDDDDDDEHEHEHGHGHDHGEHDHDHEDHDHDEHEHVHEDVDTVTIEPKNFDAETVRELQKLMKDGFFGKVYRVKGKVLYNGGAKLLQGVFDSVNLEDDPPEGPFSLTFIGDELDEAKIKKYWT
jgi:G3E family GTPase